MFARFVALGDSQTEGLNDGDELTGYRGWADRLAARLAELNPELGYANLAVRGKLAAEVRAEQLAPALALQPDLATVVAGVNDLLRRRFDAGAVAAELEAMFGALTSAGARVATVTFPDFTALVPLGGRLRPRILALNAAIAAVAAGHGVTVLDAFPHPVTADARILSPDRLHFNATGHQRFADAMAHALALPGSSDAWTDPLPLQARPGRAQHLATESRWLATYVVPRLGRRLRGRSSGDGRSAKRPTLEPVAPVDPAKPRSL